MEATGVTAAVTATNKSTASHVRSVMSISSKVSEINVNITTVARKPEPHMLQLELHFWPKPICHFLNYCTMGDRNGVVQGAEESVTAEAVIAVLSTIAVVSAVNAMRSIHRIPNFATADIKFLH